MGANFLWRQLLSLAATLSGWKRSADSIVASPQMKWGFCQG
jgi:hypothetical protein